MTFLTRCFFVESSAPTGAIVTWRASKAQRVVDWVLIDHRDDPVARAYQQHCVLKPLCFVRLSLQSDFQFRNLFRCRPFCFIFASFLPRKQSPFLFILPRASRYAGSTLTVKLCDKFAYIQITIYIYIRGALIPYWAVLTAFLTVFCNRRHWVYLFQAALVSLSRAWLKPYHTYAYFSSCQRPQYDCARFNDERKVLDTLPGLLTISF